MSSTTRWIIKVKVKTCFLKYNFNKIKLILNFKGGALDWIQICKESSKVITFIDLAGHEKYLKTTVFGMTGHVPDFCMLMVGSNAGIVGMTKR